MDYKTLAAILFRTLGLGYLVYGVFYAPYLLLAASYDGTLIISMLAILTYVAPGICLFLFSKPLAALVVKGLDRNSISPPPPPHFENP